MYLLRYGKDVFKNGTEEFSSDNNLRNIRIVNEILIEYRDEYCYWKLINFDVHRLLINRNCSQPDIEIHSLFMRNNYSSMQLSDNFYT